MLSFACCAHTPQRTMGKKGKGLTFAAARMHGDWRLVALGAARNVSPLFIVIGRARAPRGHRGRVLEEKDLSLQRPRPQTCHRVPALLLVFCPVCRRFSQRRVRVQMFWSKVTQPYPFTQYYSYTLVSSGGVGPCLDPNSGADSGTVGTVPVSEYCSNFLFFSAKNYPKIN
jgi:hypothetical protein